jgi:hypothetical protein
MDLLTGRLADWRHLRPISTNTTLKTNSTSHSQTGVGARHADYEWGNDAGSKKMVALT